MTPEQMNAIMTALTSAIVLILGALGTFIANFLKTKAEQIKKQTNNAEVDRAIDLARDIISAVVISVNQTFVEELKQGGLFTKERQAEAFEMCKNAVLKALSIECKKAISMLYGDFEAWINTQIEYYVNNAKTVLRI